MRLSTYKAYSGDRFQTAGLVLIMPRPNNSEVSGRHGPDDQGSAREETSPRELPLFKLDELKSISTFWNDIPRDDRHDPTEDATFDERYIGVASRQFGLGAAQGVAQVEARRAGRGGIPREPDPRRSWMRFTSSSRPNRARPAIFLQRWPREVSDGPRGWAKR